VVKSVSLIILVFLRVYIIVDYSVEREQLTYTTDMNLDNNIP